MKESMAVVVVVLLLADRIFVRLSYSCELYH